uniref:Uncharacterized protein n=1 Tax=Anguilla anguilla TaxID=7936 RepID=A0A0E9TCF1_ANGAN
MWTIKVNESFSFSLKLCFVRKQPSLVLEALSYLAKL